MSRRTDAERGARIALETALHWGHPDLFGLDPDFDAAVNPAVIAFEAQSLLSEGQWSRQVLS